MSRAATGAERALAGQLFEALRAEGAEAVEADVLQPAGALLDLYGEDIRARAYVTMDPLQGEMMLRPDFTLPVVLAHMTAGAEPARYTYLGEVFRKQERARAGRPAEFLQVGYEVFDRADPAASDAEVFALFARLLEPWGLRAETGDMGILRAAVQGLPVSAPRRAALMRHLWRPARFRALMERFAGRVALSDQRRAVLAGQGADAPHLGLRSAQEIAARLAALSADAAEPPLPQELIAALEGLLAIDGTLPAALPQLEALLPRLPWIAPAVAVFARRLEALVARGVDVGALSYQGSYGRTTLEYYDGFVFGFSAPGRGEWPPLASGGRYDALTAVLGQGRSIPAVGGAIRPGLLAALGEGGAC